MATYAQIRAGIKTRLDTISDLYAHTVMPPTIVSPAAVVARRSTTFDSTLSGESDDTTWAVTVFVEYTDEPTAQEALDTYTSGSGATSIRAAISGDPTLNSTVDWAQVTGVDRDRIVEWEGRKFLAADVVVEVG